MTNQMISMIRTFAEVEHSLIYERHRENIPLASLHEAYRGRTNHCPQNNKFKFDGEQQRKAMLAREFSISRETALSVSEIV